MRSEGDGIDAAIDETVRIGREAHIPVEIWHFKVGGVSNFGRMPEAVARVNAARAAGVDIAADTYAYTAWSNELSAFIPPWAHDGGNAQLVERLKDPAARARIRADMLKPSADWDNEWHEVPGPEAIMITLVQNPQLLQFQGKRLTDVAKAWNKDPMDALFDILIEDQAFTECAVFGMSEPDVSLAVQQPWVAFDNDSRGAAPEGLLGAEHPHPRAYGTFPRILRKYVREDKAADARGCDPQDVGAAGAAHAADGPRGAQAGHVGGRRGLRSRHDPRPGDLRESQPAVAGHGVRAGQRRPGHRAGQDDREAAGQGAARARVSPGKLTVNRKALPPAELDGLTARTLEHYERNASVFFEATRDHDVSQNIAALLRHITGTPPFTILDLGCGPGRDLIAFTRLGHRAIGLDGAAAFAAMARAASGCEVWQQDFLQLQLPPAHFDGVFANASLFHVPGRELPRVLRQLHAALKPGGVLFSSNPRGQNEEGWRGGRYGAFPRPGGLAHLHGRGRVH